MNPIIDGVIALEGGYLLNPKDKGGASSFLLLLRNASSTSFIT